MEDQRQEATPLEDLEKIEEEMKEKAPEEVKPKRKRKKKKPEPEPEPEITMNREDTQNLLGWLFDTVAERLGPHWRLKPKESEQGAELINRVIIKRAPQIAAYSEELALAGWALAISMPRLRITRQRAVEAYERGLEEARQGEE